MLSVLLNKTFPSFLLVVAMCCFFNVLMGVFFNEIKPDPISQMPKYRHLLQRYHTNYKKSVLSFVLELSQWLVVNYALTNVSTNYLLKLKCHTHNVFS